MGLKSNIRPMPLSDMVIARAYDALERTDRAVEVLVWKRDRNGLPEAVLTLGSSPRTRRVGAGAVRL